MNISGKVLKNLKNWLPSELVNEDGPQNASHDLTHHGGDDQVRLGDGSLVVEQHLREH